MIIKHLTIFCILLCHLDLYAQDDDRLSEIEVAYQEKFIEAKGYILLDKPEKSEEILTQLYREDRSNVAIAMELANLYGKLDDPASQHKYAKIAADNANGNVFVLDKYGQVCMDTGKYSEAVLAYKKIVAREPRSEEYTDKLATALIKEGSHREAIEAYQDLELLIGISQDVTRRKFELYDLIGEPKKAIAELEALAAAQPSNLEALHTLAKYYKKQGQNKKSRKVYESILEVDINDTMANIELMGSADTPVNDDNYLRALSPIIENKDVPLDNKVLELMQYVQKYASNGDPDLGAALEEVGQRLVAIHPDEAKSHALMGDILYLSSKYADAIKSYNRTLTLNNRVYTVWEQLMYALAETKNYKDLLERSSEAIDLYPNKASAFLLHGIALRESGKYQEATAYLEEGALVSGKDLFAKSNIYSELASTCIAAGKLDAAEVAVTTALTLSDHKNPRALEVKGDLAMKQGDKTEATKFWQLAKQAGGTNSSLTNKLK